MGVSQRVGCSAWFGVKSLLLSDEVTLCGRHDWLEGGQRLSLTRVTTEGVRHSGLRKRPGLGHQEIGVVRGGQLTSPERPTLTLLWVLAPNPVPSIKLQPPQIENSSKFFPDHLP